MSIPESPAILPAIAALWSQSDPADAARFAAGKAAAFALLATLGITQVVISFNGYGDEGQIEEIVASAGDTTLELPPNAIVPGFTDRNPGFVGPVAVTIADALEHLAYDLLGETHMGWQDGEGAYGDFTFDVAARTITLDHNDRYVAVESTTHEF